MKNLKEQLEDMKKQRAIWEKEIAELQNGINILLKLEKLVEKWIGQPTVEKKPLCNAGCCFECDKCTAEPGSPLLCESCVKRRADCNRSKKEKV